MNQQLANFGIEYEAGIGIAGVLHLNSGGSFIGDSILEKS